MTARDDIARWELMLGLYAELQVRASAHVPALLAAGAPDRRPAALRGLFEQVVAAERGLSDSSEKLSEPERARLLGLAGKVEQLAGELAASGLPASIDHSDLHAGNVLAPGEGYVFFDWHEAAVTHPFFSMVVATRWLARNHGVEPGSAQDLRLRDAYLDAFTGYASRDALRAALDLALRIGPLTRALGWMRVLEGLPPAAQAEWAEHAPAGCATSRPSSSAPEPLGAGWEFGDAVARGPDPASTPAARAGPPPRTRRRRPGARRSARPEPLRLLRAQLDAADLARDRLRQRRELEPAHALVRRQVLPGVAHDGKRRLARRLLAGGERHVGLRHRKPQRVGRGHHRRLGHRLVLDQHALELERRDAVVRRLEHVVGAADVGDVALGVAAGDVARVVVAAVHRLGGALAPSRGSRS